MSSSPIYIRLSPEVTCIYEETRFPLYYFYATTTVAANMVQYQERSSQEMPEVNPTYINLDPDHCHPEQNLAYGMIAN